MRAEWKATTFISILNFYKTQDLVHFKSLLGYLNFTNLKHILRIVYFEIKFYQEKSVYH